MEHGDRQRNGPEQAAASREPQRAERPAPGKVSRTSKLAPGRGPAVQRKAPAPAADGADGASSRSRSLWDHTMDPWMDAAHRGAQALVQAKADSGVARDAPVPRRLNELESMRWTLHGCHRIQIEMDYRVSEVSSDNKTVTFTNMHFRWIDVGDMHPGTETETDSGEVIDDADLMGAGASFPIDIPFAAPGSSVWQVSGGTAAHRSGWPSASTATSTRYRGE